LASRRALRAFSAPMFTLILERSGPAMIGPLPI
jgi:hypothetical protein